MKLSEHVAHAVHAERERSKAIFSHGVATSAPASLIVSAVLSGMAIGAFHAEVIAHRISAA
jgi:uncharacterized membrane protein